MEVTQGNNPMSQVYGMKLKYPTSLFDADVQEALIRDHFEGTTNAYDMQFKKLNEPGSPAPVQQGNPNNNTPQPTPSGFANNNEYEEYKRLKSLKDASDLENVLNTVFGTAPAGIPQQPVAQPPTQVPQPVAPTEGQAVTNMFDDLFGGGTPPATPAQPPQENANLTNQASAQDYNTLAKREVYKTALANGVNPNGFFDFMSSISMDDFVNLYKSMTAQQSGQNQPHPQQPPTSQPQADMNPINLASLPTQRNVQYEQPYMRTGGRLTGTIFE